MLKQVISRLLLPNLEQDMSRSLSRQLAKVHDMTDCMIAPTVHAFEPAAMRAGSFAATAKQAQRLVKVEYAVPGKGLFQ
jgi:hypothetical protein